MEIAGTQKSRDDRTSACRSFGSNHHPCSQSRKISIGVMVDFMPKSRAKATKENECKANLNENQIDQERNTSPKKPISENIHQSKPTIDSPAGENLKKLSRDYSVKEGEEEGERKGTKGLLSENVWEFSVPEKEGGEDKIIGPEDRRQVLKLKLWEILGANSSANEEASQAPEMGGNNLIPESEINRKCKAAVKPKQDSDKTGSNNQSPDRTIKRAVTRSLTRKKAISKEPGVKTRNVRKSRNTKKSLEKNIFSFNEGQFGKVCDAVTGDSPKFIEKNLGRKGSKEEGPRFSFPEKLVIDEVSPALDSSKMIKGTNKLSLFGNITRNFQNIPPRNSSRLVDAENGNQENGSSLSSATKRRGKGFNADEDKITEDVDSSIGKRRRFNRISPPEKRSEFIVAENGAWRKEFSLSPAKKKKANSSLLRTPHNSVQQKDFGTAFKNNTNPHEYIQSPTFEVRTLTKAFSPGSPLKASEGELNDQSLQDYIFTSPVSLKPDQSAPDAGTRTSNDEEEAEDSPISKSTPIMSEHDSEDAVDVSSPEKMDSESSKEGYKGWGTEAMSPDIGTSMNPEFGLYTNKRLRSQEKFEFRRFSPILASPEDNCSEENDGSQGPPETNEENGLANAISLLALALQRVKSKIKTVTSKKSTEVLLSVAEEIHLQLQNAESQFERDVGKLTSLNKSQRKHLETELEEQQEKLKIIYQKFKSDVSQHIQEHRSKVEGLQGQERELRLFMEKRNASQKEALKQMEESIQDQLSDAEMRIADVHKMGREKMLQLKQALGKCLKEGMLG